MEHGKMDDDRDHALSELSRMAEDLGAGDLRDFCSSPDAGVYLFGRGIVSGGMCTLESGDATEAYLVARTERAARDLLSRLPHDRSLVLHIPQDWVADRADLQLDLTAVEAGVYEGQRRRPRLPEGVSELHAKVESQKHPTIDLARSLRTEKGRDESGMYAAHGPLLLSRALAANAPIEYVLYAPKFLSEPEADGLLQRLQALGIPHYVITDGLMRKCVDTAYVPPVLSVVRKQIIRMADLYLGPKALVLVAESVEEPGNLGMILRTADAVAADAVAVCGTGSDPYAWKTVTGSRGSVFRVPIVHLRDGVALSSSLKKKGAAVVGADLSGDRSHFDLDYTCSTAFLVGNESDGLTSTALDTCDHRVRILMPGEPDSLNVGVSAGVLLYEALRQRMGVGGRGTGAREV